MLDVDEDKGSKSRPGEAGHYLYRSAGITERSGHVPSWLLLVVVGLFVWGVYYLVTYWSPMGL